MFQCLLLITLFGTLIPMFRDRPLTWLFIAATICVDLVLIELGDIGSYLQSGFWLGQMAVLGAWFAVGKSHRLARASVVLGGVAFLTLIACYRRVDHVTAANWGSLFRITAWNCLFAFCCALFCRIFVQRFCRKCRIEQRWKAPRFPLIELFGWTIIVAVGSVLSRPAIKVNVQYNWFRVLTMGLSAAVVGMMAALFLVPNRGYRFTFLLAAIGVGGFWLYAFLTTSHTLSFIEYGVMQSYTALWVFVQRLDSSSLSQDPTRSEPDIEPNLLIESVSSENN